MADRQALPNRRGDHHRVDHRRTDIAGQVVGQTEISLENRVLRDLVAVYRHLSGLALQDADITTVTQLIADRTDATVAVVNEKLDILAAAAPGEEYERAAEYVAEHVVRPRLGQVLVTAGATRRALRLPASDAGISVIVAPILVGDDVPAYLITLDREEHGLGEDISLLLTEHAATICGVILGRERVVAAAASRVRGDLIEGLLAPRGRNDAEIRRWATHLGYDADQSHHVLSVVLGPANQPPGADRVGRSEATIGRAAMAAERFFTARASDAITAIREREVVVVLPEVTGSAPLYRATQLASACRARVGALFPDVMVTVGIGAGCRQPTEIARSYAEARRTIEAMSRMGMHGGVTAFDALGIHRLLLQVPDLGELRGFAAAVLGKLSSHRHNHRAEYLSTLACYFRESNSPQRASRALHVHPNTVTYRIRRVEEITGLDFDNYRDRLMAQVALEILNALGDGESPDSEAVV